jgi:hypothetical protein
LRRSLGKEARTLAIRIEKIDATLVSHEAQITQMEALFSNPDQIGDRAQLAALGEQHKVLTNESHCLLEEWGRLSLEAEGVDSQLKNLDSTK